MVQIFWSFHSEPQRAMQWRTQTHLDESAGNNRSAAVQLARIDATPPVVVVARYRPSQDREMVGSWQFIPGGRSGCVGRAWYPGALSEQQVGVPERAASHSRYACRKLRELFLNEFAACQSLDWHESTIWFLISSSARIVTIHERITVKCPETKWHVFRSSWLHE